MQKQIKQAITIANHKSNSILYSPFDFRGRRFPRFSRKAKVEPHFPGRASGEFPGRQKVEPLPILQEGV
jgi:hypothetical protein